jgi:hypothetical protein
LIVAKINILVNPNEIQMSDDRQSLADAMIMSHILIKYSTRPELPSLPLTPEGHRRVRAAMDDDAAAIARWDDEGGAPHK